MILVHRQMLSPFIIITTGLFQTTIRSPAKGPVGRVLGRMLMGAVVAEGVDKGARIAFDNKSLIEAALLYGPDAIVNTPDAICRNAPVVKLGNEIE